MHITTFQTSRLDLRPWPAHQTKLLHELFTDPFIRRFLWDDLVIPLEKTREILEENALHFAEERWGLWQLILRKTEKPIGFAGLWPFFDEPRPQLLYGLLSAYTGKGYATEAGRWVVDYAFQELGFEYLNAATDGPHLPSQRVLRRLGMQLVDEREVEGKPTVFYQIRKPTGKRR